MTFHTSFTLFFFVLAPPTRWAAHTDAFSVSKIRTAPSSYSHCENPSTQKNRKTILNDKAALIFLHGLGDTPDGWSKLAEALPSFRPNLKSIDLKYVFPPAPIVEITVNGGEPMPGWFDVFDWPIGVDAKDDPKGLAHSVKKVENIVKKLEKDEGISPSRVVVGGFSQGGAVALMAAYNRRKKNAIPFAGCMCLSGWLPLKHYLNVTDEAAKSTPLFWSHGKYDEKILFEQQACGVKHLQEAGVDITSLSYPVGHESSNFEEIEAMADFLDSVLSPKSKGSQFSTPIDASSLTEPDSKTSKNLTEKTQKEESRYFNDKNVLLYYLCAIGVQENFPDC